MIQAFRDKYLADFYWDGVIGRSVPSTLINSLRRRLDVIHYASTEADLRVPPANRFEHLQGRLLGWCSIRVNRQYRLIFKWESGSAFDVYLDPHTYR